MKIKEITEQNSVIRRVAGNKVTIDHGNGREETIDTEKNPDALTPDDNNPNQLNQKDDRGNSGPQGQNSNNRNNRIRVGQKVQTQS